MLPKTNRLKKNKDIERVFKKGKGYRGDFLFLKITKNSLDVSRFAFIVSRKVAPKAAYRNKIKRRLREAARRPLSRIKTGFDIVIVAQKGLETKNFQAIERDMERLFKKANLIKP